MTPEPAPPPDPDRGRRAVPPTVTAGAGLVVLEAVAVAAYAVAYVVRLFPLGDEALVRALMAAGVTVFLLLTAAALAAAARALLDLRHWPRALLVAVQLIVLATALPLALDGLLLAWVFAVLAAAITAMVLAPTTTAAIER